MSYPKLKGLKAKATPKKRYGSMNKTEARWAEELEAYRTAGTILRWDFEPEKLRLADGAYYSPDFRVIENDLSITFYEVKGFRREAAIVRIKVAADQHPYVFKMVYWKNKQWLVEEV